MHTITPNSETLCQSNLFKRIGLWFLILILTGLFSGCAGVTKVEDFFKLTPESAKLRALQTRLFETSDEKELLSASAAVLQDLGFQVEECSTDVGMLRAAKERGAREYGQEIMQVFIFIFVAGLSGESVLVPIDLQQQISATLVTRQSETDASRYSVRILFYRSIWKGDGQSGDQSIPPGTQRMEMINNEKVYQQFFSKLSKSIFLEAQEI